MRGNLFDLVDWLVGHAPAVVLWSLAAGIAASWSGIVPSLLVYALALAIGVADLLVVALRVLPLAFSTTEELGFQRNRDLIWYEVADKGIDDNAYGLALGCFVAALLMGFQAPYLCLVVACGGLVGAWAAATRKWPKDQ